MLIDSEGAGRLDVRIVLETKDGALIYCQYPGVAENPQAAQAAVERGKPLDYGETYFATQPRFETGDERYKWLNRLVAAGEGRVVAGAVEYRVFEVIPG